MQLSKSLFFLSAFLAQSAADKGGVDTSKIYNGDNAVEGQFPYYVKLATCGAQLIAPRIVLTAAHCKAKENLKGLGIGAVKRKDFSFGGATVRDCLLWINHPLWNDDVGDGNDYALCYLDERVDLDPSYGVTLELNQDPAWPPVGSKTTAAGMGYNSFFFGQPNTLQYTELSVIDTDDCAPGNQNPGLDNDETILCTEDPNTSTCGGDSGGPLVTIATDPATGEEVHTLVGLTSFGYGIFCPTDVAGFARISAPAGLDWVKSMVCGNNVEASFCTPSCDNDTTWLYRNRPGEDCDWVADTPTRCNLPGASESCPAVCYDECSSSEVSTAPASAP